MNRLSTLVLGALVLTAASLSAMTAATDHPGSVPILLSLDKVRSALQITSLQKAVLDSLRSEYKVEARKIVATAPTTPEARAAAEKQLFALTQRYNKRALSVLNDSQRARFVQIEHRLLGGVALFTPSVQKKLKLSSTQIAQIEKIRQDGLVTVAKINHRFEDGAIGYQERIALLHSRKIAQGVVLAKVLTPEQLVQFRALAGQPIKA